MADKSGGEKQDAAPMAGPPDPSVFPPLTGSLISTGLTAGVGRPTFGDPETLPSESGYIPNHLLTLVNPDTITRPSAKRPLGLTPETMKDLLLLVPYGLIRIQPIVETAAPLWRRIMTGGAPNIEGLTADEFAQLAKLCDPAVASRAPLPPAGVTPLPLEEVRELASRLELIFSPGSILEHAMDVLGRRPNIARVERPVQAYAISTMGEPPAPIPIPGPLPNPLPQSVLGPKQTDWWKDIVYWDAANGSADNLAGAAIANIAVLDSGVDDAHPALKGALLENALFSYGPPRGDRYGHGTHVSSIIAGRRSPDPKAPPVPDGILPSAKIYVFNIFSPGKSTIDMGSFKTALHAVLVNQKDVKVINLSIWMTLAPDVDLMREFQKLEDAGVLIVACAGNQFTYAPDPDENKLYRDGVFRVEFPARLPYMLSVAALAQSGKRAYFSRFSTRGKDGIGGNDYGAWQEKRWPLVDISAPGDGIAGAVPWKPSKAFFGTTAGIYSMQGTSMATPMVTAAAGYLFAQPLWKDATPAQVRQALRKCVHRDRLCPGLPIWRRARKYTALAFWTSGK